MLLRPDPSLAEVPDFSPTQLERLTRSVEQKKQKLEDDIRDYIRRKQDELRKYERELLEQYRSMERAPSTQRSDDKVSNQAQPATTNLPSNYSASPSRPAELSSDSKKLGPGETAKRTKHTRVHKREKELCGLVTPIFLPLLDAGDTLPAKKKKEKRRHTEEKGESVRNSPPSAEKGSPSRDADQGQDNRRSRSKNRDEKMECGEDAVAAGAVDENQKLDSGKKSKRSTVKKSSLRHMNTPRNRRKRVSLVIDDQIVLPADNIVGPPLTSPSETTASTVSNSTTSLEDIDPRLVPHYDTPAHLHQEPVHHSLALPTSLPSTSPTKHTGHALSESPVPLAYDPPQTATRTFLDHSPSKRNPNISQYNANPPIYAGKPELAETEEEDFSTYVGGIDGSGVDNVDQAGSYGYPSSLGASYLESYMKSRPLSVRVAAAEKAELEEEEKKALISGERELESNFDLGIRKVDDVDEGMDIMGGMEGF